MDKLKLILDRRKNIIGKSEDSMDNFLEKWGNALDLINAINKNIKQKTLVQEARRNYVINIVTGLEVFLKDTFIQIVNNDLSLNIDHLVKKKVKKFTLEEVEFIRKNKISKGEIIAEYCNFQNLIDVNTVYSLLLNFNFFDELKKYKWYYDKNDPNGYMQLDKNFYPTIKKLIDLRHSFIHDINFKKTLTMDEINNFHTEIIVFVSQVRFFLENLSSGNIPWPIKQYNS